MVPIGEVIADLPGPVQALRETPRPRRCSEASPLLRSGEPAWFQRPRSGRRSRFHGAHNGALLPAAHQPRQPDFSISASTGRSRWESSTATGNHKLPFGNLPRLLLAWVSTEAVRTRSRVLVSRVLHFPSSCGRWESTAPAAALVGNANPAPQPDEAAVRLHCLADLSRNRARSFARVNSVSRPTSTEFWWNERKPDELSLWESKIELGEDLSSMKSSATRCRST